jgi:hypothetical protein
MPSNMPCPSGHPRAPILKPTEREHVPDALQRRADACIFGQISRCLSSSIIRSVDPICTSSSRSVLRVGNNTTPWGCLPAADISGLLQAGSGRSGQPVLQKLPESSPDDLVSSHRSDARGQLCSIRATAFPIHNYSVSDAPFGRRRYPRSPINLPTAYASGRNREYRLIPMYRPSYPPGSV